MKCSVPGNFGWLSEYGQVDTGCCMSSHKSWNVSNITNFKLELILHGFSHISTSDMCLTTPACSFFEHWDKPIATCHSLQHVMCQWVESLCCWFKAVCCQMYWGWHVVSLVLVFDSQSSRLSDDSRVSRASRLDLQPVGGTTDCILHTTNSLLVLCSLTKWVVMLTIYKSFDYYWSM